MAEIIYIGVNQISPHPENPRKDLGDLSELVESIKVNGILQNLTVVPWYGRDDMYTVIIGHRRLAAAKEAGLKEVPCSIAKLSLEEQIAVMLTENMQRTDLTIYEQAKAFQQLSLDFGMSVAEIAEKSGFSETTVRKRVKLAELDEEKFKKACRRGATLYDFAELEKVEAPEAKDKCLDAIGTNNFKNVLKSALDEQKYLKRREGWIQQLQKFATQVQQRGYLDGQEFPMGYVGSFNRWSRFDDIEIPDDAEEVRYFFVVVDDYDITLLKERIDKPEDPETIRRNQLKEAQTAKCELMEGIALRHFELRKEFVRDYGAAKSNADKIIRYACEVLLSGGLQSWTIDNKDLFELTGLQFKDGTGEIDRNLFRELREESPEKMMLALAYWRTDFKRNNYLQRVWDFRNQYYRICFKHNQELDNLLYFLESLGYPLSDEELQMRRGAHRLFDEVPDDDN